MLIPSRILDPRSRMMALPLVPLHLPLPRLPLPCVAYQIHSFANTESAYEPISTCIAPWLSPSCSVGSEAWSITLADRRRIDVFDMRCQRHLLRVFWQQHIRNQSTRERTKQPTASSFLRQRRLRWFGHLHRMPSSLPVRRVFDFNPNIHGWKIPRGSPKTRWADSIKHDLHSAGLDTINAPQMVFDRPKFCLRTANRRSNPSKALKSSISQVKH